MRGRNIHLTRTNFSAFLKSRAQNCAHFLGAILGPCLVVATKTLPRKWNHFWVRFGTLPRYGEPLFAFPGWASLNPRMRPSKRYLFLGCKAAPQKTPQQLSCDTVCRRILCPKSGPISWPKVVPMDCRTCARSDPSSCCPEFAPISLCFNL